MPRIFFTLAVLLVVVGTVPSSAAGTSGGRTRATDLIVLNNGWRLKGIVLNDSPDAETASVLLRTDWLRESVPKLLNADHPQEHPASAAAQQLEQQIERLKAADVPRRARIDFLAVRLKELEYLAGQKSDAPKITVLHIPVRLVRRHDNPPVDARQLGFLGILNNIDDTEVLSPKRLRNTLKLLPPESLITTLPQVRAVSADHLVRNALLNADQEIEPTCRLIRIGRSFVSADGGQNEMELVTQLVTQQLRDELLSLNETQPTTQPTDSQKATSELPASAIQLARGQSAALVEVAEVRLDLNAGTASVRLTLYHRQAAEPDTAAAESANETWPLVGSVIADATTADVGADRAASIADDPQVGRVLEIFKSIGAGPQDISKALTLGAVVEAAQQDAQHKLKSLIPPLLEYAEQPGITEITLNELPEE